MCIFLWPEFDCPEVTLCGWQDIKIQLLLLRRAAFWLGCWCMLLLFLMYNMVDSLCSAVAAGFTSCCTCFCTLVTASCCPWFLFLFSLSANVCPSCCSWFLFLFSLYASVCPTLNSHSCSLYLRVCAGRLILIPVHFIYGCVPQLLFLILVPVQFICECVPDA